MTNGLQCAGRILAAVFGLACSGAQAGAAERLLPAGKCPFTLDVTETMRADSDPFGGMETVSRSYRASEEQDGLRVSFSQRRDSTRVAYAIRCSAADPAKWLARFAGDETAVCRRLNRFPDEERKANAFCRLTDNGKTRLLMTGTSAKSAKEPGLSRSRARFTAALAGVGMISGRVFVTSTDVNQARVLAEELAATLGVASAAAE